MRDVALLCLLLCFSSAVSARFGGDELVVMLPETDADGARRVAERIADGVRSLVIEHGDNQPPGILTLSIGVAALVPGAGQASLELFERADRALYQAKHLGRDRVVLMEP